MAKRCGHLAMQFVGRDLPLQALESRAGFYLGTADREGPVTRESVEYFPDREAAERALVKGEWTQRLAP
jgi:hypothetical protein